ncbi:hypothetical protein Pme01_03120 [Planosporangium mesophilum]|uniref:Uncharacterized protein n=1 Tax=Planosporangium mesophilum TaxID=689768 RepID=A0A8J3TFS8_9ACTN|nr:hypothetical protein Pme01_03120 [Planosporangium mesophilum]
MISQNAVQTSTVIGTVTASSRASELRKTTGSDIAAPIPWDPHRTGGEPASGARDHGAG